MQIQLTVPKFSAFVFRANLGGPDRKTPYILGGFADKSYLGNTLERPGQLMIVERHSGGQSGKDAVVGQFEF